MGGGSGSESDCERGDVGSDDGPPSSPTEESAAAAQLSAPRPQTLGAIGSGEKGPTPGAPDTRSGDGSAIDGGFRSIECGETCSALDSFRYSDICCFSVELRGLRSCCTAIRMA